MGLFGFRWLKPMAMKKIFLLFLLFMSLVFAFEELYIDIGEMNFKRNADNRISFVVHKEASEGNVPQKTFVEIYIHKGEEKIWIELNKDEWKDFRELVEKTDSIITKQ